MNKIARSMALAVAGIATLGLTAGCAGQAPTSNESAATQVAAPGGTADSFVGAAPEFGPPQAPPPVEEKRDVVKTASMTVTVPDPSTAADDAAVIVERSDGRVDSRTEDAGSGTGRAVTSVVLRVPVAKLDEVMRELKELGTVETATTTSEDVTAQRVDLDARIEALRTSVDRLLAIMRDARDPEALITAEDALSERQAELDSLRAQREALGDRVSYSTVDVTFYAEVVGGPAPEEYVGFLGQVQRGWDGLVAVTGGAILIFGVMLPWLAVVLVLGAIVYGIYRVSRRRSVTPPAEPAPPPSDEQESVRQ